MSNGKFSIRSAYTVAMKLRGRFEIGNCSNDGPIRNFWRNIWSLQIPNKVKHFAWRACKNILPCLSNPKRKGIMVDDKCVLCGVEGELQVICFRIVQMLRKCGSLLVFFSLNILYSFRILWICFDFFGTPNNAMMMPYLLLFPLLGPCGQEGTKKGMVRNS